MTVNHCQPSAPPDNAENQARVWGLVAAAGVGARMGGSRPKQYLVVDGRPLVHHSLERLCQCDAIAGVVVGLAAADRWWEAERYSHPVFLGAYTGAAKRSDTVANGLSRLQTHHQAAATDWVVVHDAARPLVAQQDIRRVIDRARANRVGAVLGVFVTDTLKAVDAAGRIAATTDRDRLFRAMTPQVFRVGQLSRALAQCRQAGTEVTDESMAMEKSGLYAEAVVGSALNIKLTTPDDWELLRHAMARRSDKT